MSHRSPTVEPAVQEFADSMPSRYREAVTEPAMTDHARLWAERQGSTVQVGRCHSRGRPSTTAICVVADDRPGLLAMISAALVLTNLDIVHAEAYTRKPTLGRAEAIDVFWVRDRSRPESDAVTDERLGEVRNTLSRLLEGSLLPSVPAELAAAQRRSRPLETRVRFLEGGDGVLSTLEVETYDRFGLLLALAGALFRLDVQILRSEVHTQGHRVLDRFEITELDGTPIGPERRLRIQVAVLSAVEPVSEGRRSSPKAPGTC